jgi:uncharacterized protein Smg (DUF494 family)
MSIHKLVHGTFITLYVVSAILVIIVIYKKFKNKKAPKELTREKFNKTLKDKMIEEKDIQNAMFNIWPFVNHLKTSKTITKNLPEKELVYKVYKNKEYEHILLFTEKENNYIVIVVNTLKMKVKGYYALDLKNEYEY